MEQEIQAKGLSWIEAMLPQLGLSHFGVSNLKKPLSFAHYETWLASGHHADMKYLEHHLEKKASPEKTFSPARSAMVFAAPYVNHPSGVPPFKEARVALYAQGNDYHFWLKEKLQIIVNQLKIQYPSETFLILTDSAPLLERDLAYQAGLGWFGKNSCLIHPKHGSLFLIGEILTSLEFTSKKEPLPDFCGTCNRCIDICPTKAITSQKKVDANKCISYWTIESRGMPPANLSEKFGDWLFGCDLCQTVCPWNQKIYKNQLSVQQSLQLEGEQSAQLTSELKWILESSGKKIQKQLRLSPLLRAGPRGLKRNALIVIANRKMTDLIELVQAQLVDPRLKDLAEWTLQKLIKT